MSKVFKRPMFRRGGNVGTGIMTGIVDRGNYQDGTDPMIGDTNQFSDPIKRYKNEASTLNTQADNNFYTPLPKEDIDPVMTTKADMKMPADLFPKPDFGKERDSAYYIDQLKKGGGEYGGMDPLTSFLLTAGPAITKATSFGDAISKLGPANKQLIEQAEKKADYLRKIGLTASEMSLSNQEKIEGRKYKYGVDLKDKEYKWAENMNNRLYGEKATGVQWAKEALKQKEKLTREDWLSQQAAVLSKASAADAKAWELEMAKNNQSDAIELIKQRAEQTKQINAAERDLRLGDDKKALITDSIADSMKDDRDMLYDTAKNAAEWTYGNNTKYRDQGKIGFILTEANLKDTVAYAKKQVKKGAGDGSIHYDPVDNIVYQIQKDGEGGHNLVEVFETGSSGATQAENKKDEESQLKSGDSETDSAYQKKETRGGGEVLEKITPKDTGFFEKPVFESIEEITAIENVPMTGKEIKEKYEINFPLNDKTVYAPTDNIYKSITN
jgi:hypothetical protein